MPIDTEWLSDEWNPLVGPIYGRIQLGKDIIGRTALGDYLILQHH